MPVLNVERFLSRTVAQTHGEKLLFGSAHRPSLVDHRARVFASSKFRYPAPDELASRILVALLLGGRIDAERIDARGSRLHLHLAPVDTRLKVEKLSGQMKAGFTPMQPQVMCGEAHEHRAHAKIQPARSVQTSHACIDQGIPGVAVFPCFEACKVKVILPQAIVTSRCIKPFEGGLGFQPLNEVAMPVQAPDKTMQMPGEAMCVGVVLAC